jgi:hypothetical protein
MRILHITPYFSPHVGGTETLTYEFASCQCKLAHGVIVLTSRSPSNAPLNETTSDGVHALRLPTKEIFERPVCWGIRKALSRLGESDVMNLWTPFQLADTAALRYATKRALTLVITYVKDAITSNVLGSRVLARVETQLSNQFKPVL